MMLAQSLVYLIGRLLPGILSIAAIAIMTRSLTPEQYGLYALVIASVTMLNAVVFTWNSKGVYRSYALVQSNPKRLFRAAIVGFSLSYSACLIAGIAIYIFAIDFIDVRILFGGAALLGTYSWIELTSSILNLENRASAYVTLLTLRGAANVLLGGGVAWLTGSAAWVTCSMAAGWGILAVIPRFSRWASLTSAEPVARDEIMAMLRYGAPLSLSIALSQLISSADRWLLGWMSGPSAVAMYSAGYDLVQFCIGAMGSALSLAYYPRIIAAADIEGTEQARAVLSVYSVLQLAIMLPAAVGLAYIAWPLADVLIGPSLREGAAEVMPLISISALLITIKAFYVDFSFQLGRWTLGGAISSAVALAINVVGNIALVPHFGILGSAIAAVISTAIALGISLILGRKFGFPLPGVTLDHLRVIASVGLMALVLQFATSGHGLGGLIVDISIGSATYVASVVLLNPLHARHHLIKSLRRAHLCLVNSIK